MKAPGRVSIFGRSFNDDAIPYVKELFGFLDNNQVQYEIYEGFDGFLAKKSIITHGHGLFSGYHDIKGEMVISIGGDGTMLESVTVVRDKKIPILGINTGRLGFLSSTPRERIREDLDKLFTGKFDLEERSLLWLDSDRDIFNGLNFGLNEFSIIKRDSSSMIIVHTYIDGIFLNSYWADGLIVATPTGSTGYSLSCGGPVVLPGTNNFIITPVSGHNLNVRPLIVSATSEISFQIEGRSRNFLISLDSRSKTVDASVKLSVRKADFPVVLVRLEGITFLNTLRNKLNWGVDIRN